MCIRALSAPTVALAFLHFVCVRTYPTCCPNDVVRHTELDFNRSPPTRNVLSREEEECIERSKVYFNGSCYDLVKKGPCKHGQLLVLDRNASGIRPICVDDPCNGDQVQWPPGEECQPLGKSPLCRKRATELTRTSTGDAVCRCAKVGPPRAMAANGACYELYTQGPCRVGRVITIGDDGLATCTDWRCAPNEAYIDGKCHKFESSEPCPNNTKLHVDALTGQLVCSILVEIQALAEQDSFCPGVNHRGGCEAELKLHKKNLTWMTFLKDKTRPPQSSMPQR